MSDSIVISAAPVGRFLEGIISGTPKPGQVVQVQAATEPIGGKLTWEVYNRAADGNRPQGPLAVLLESYFLGRTVNDAYVDGEQCRMYVPIPGDELQVLLANIGGTSDSFAIGDLLIVDDGTGKAIATTGSPQSEPFMITRTIAAGITVDTLGEVYYTGY